ncbi:hypothetical protein [Olsenella urininfantis]|uniref:hypothetical protein n=1 Tax=Olsenella urininfantis TaxID=1871033 RepID=UPI0009870FAB|nr:hypothetical protein [Olsenella urininfantis]
MAELRPEDAARLLHDGKLDVLVPSPTSRNVSGGVIRHLFSHGLPEGSLRMLAPDVLIASPELCFLLMSDTLGMPCKIVELGFELCGSYAFQPDGKQPAGSRPPLTSVGGLSAYLDRCPGLRGYAKARAALRWVMDGSASPMETLLAMELGMPKKLGGRGFPPFALNRRIALPDMHLRRLARRSHVYVDLLFEGAGLCLEFDSYEHHAGRVEYDNTQARANALRALGYSVNSITFGQVRTLGRFDDLVWSLETQLDLRHRSCSDKGRARQRELHALLVNTSRRRF